MNITSELITSDTIDITEHQIVSNYQNIKIYNHNDKKILVKRITDIKNKKCYIKIFKIIHNDNFKYTKNYNGIFFNLTNLSDIILHNIETVIIYYENKKLQNELLLKNNNSYLSNDNIDDSIDSEYINNSPQNIINKNNCNNIIQSI